MKKALIGFSATLVLSVFVVFIKASSPFGWLFTNALNLSAISLVSIISLAGILFWKKKSYYRWFAPFLFALSLFIALVGVIMHVDYRVLLPITQATSLSHGEWQEDVEFLRTKLETHPAYNDSLNTIISEQLNSFVSEIDITNRDQKLLQIIKLVAVFKDGHSFVPPFQVSNRSRYFPLNGFYFDDGYYVLAAATEYRTLVNKKVTKIGSEDIKGIFGQVEQIAGPENPWNAKYRFDFYVYSANLLQSLGIIDNDYLKVTYLDANEEREVYVKSAPFMNWMFWSLKPTADRLPISVKLRQPNYKLNFEDGILDLQLNSIENNSDEDTIKKLAERLDRVISEEGVKKLIIDLRNNIGGNNELYDPLIDVIRKHEGINQKEKLFVFTSRTTFSAGVNFLDDLDFHTNATLVGEPSGAGSNHYGDANLVFLPNSGIYFFLSTKRWEGNDKSDARKFIEPDIKISFKFSHYRNGIDPWFEAIN